MVVEAGLGNMNLAEVVVELGAGRKLAVSWPGTARAACVACRIREGHPLELLLVINDLDAMLIALNARLSADGGEMSVHREMQSGLVHEVVEVVVRCRCRRHEIDNVAGLAIREAGVCIIRHSLVR